jgi:hypothetical protein
VDRFPLFLHGGLLFDHHVTDITVRSQA